MNPVAWLALLVIVKQDVVISFIKVERVIGAIP